MERTKLATKIKRLTKYQRMRLAYELAETLKDHHDPTVQDRALEITYALGAPMSTLLNVLDLFPRQIVESVVRTPGPADALVEQMRGLRKRGGKKL